MTDFILKVRLSINDNAKNKKLISKFIEWLNQEYPKPSYNELALEFVHNVLKSAQIPFDGDMTTQLSHSARYDYLEDLRHPKLEKNGKWFLDDLQMKNKSVIWLKLENQWLKGKIEIKGKSSNIVFEPENIAIPISESLFLRW
jgi:hypothetical protein